MKNKGFTLVELLSVIVILSVLMLIAIPTAVGVSSKVKEKLLEEKIVLAEKSAILWAQDNKICFTINQCSELTSSGFSCTDNKDFKKCTINVDYLAISEYQDYDEGKKIINPFDPVKCLNFYKIDVKYTKKSKTFSANIPRENQDSKCP